MIERYRNQDIHKTWSDENKLSLWQKVELAVIEAREKLGRIVKGTLEQMKKILLTNPIDLVWWKAQEKKTRHDLNSFVDERKRHLATVSTDLASRFHEETTSYDDEEPAMAEMLETSAQLVLQAGRGLRAAIEENALLYRFTPMLTRTHGQWAQIQSFGYECLTWHEDLGIPLAEISNAISLLRFTKCSGAVGNNAEIDPELEHEALKILGRQPWHGATQIMPRALYAQLACGLAHLVMQCEKIALDIRLGGRSGTKIMEEPFDPLQEGSSAMPQKRNNILTEQICGMGRVARGFAGMLEENIVTWESRAIEQSCVERIAWPDLFHTAMRVLTVLAKVVSKLNVYPDAMMREIAMSAGTYASNAAKTFLAKRGAEFGITSKDAYGIVRLAGHIAFEPGSNAAYLRKHPQQSLSDADGMYRVLVKEFDLQTLPESIEYIISCGKLHARPDIGVDEETVKHWLNFLKDVFAAPALDEWHALFNPSRGMRNEAHSFQQVFKV